MKASLHSIESDLLKSWSLGVWRGHNMGNFFTVVSMGKGGKAVRATLGKSIFKCVF
jgi:hypothetical protein